MLAEVKERYYRLLHPRPAYIIASGTLGRRQAVMAASWVTPVSEEPPRVAVMWDKESYTLQVAKEARCFTVNIVDVGMLDKLWYVGTVSGWEEPDKAAKAGLRLIETPAGCIRVDGVIGFIDARIHKVVEDAADDVDIVIGDVVGAYADTSLFDARRGWNVSKARIPLQVAGSVFMTSGRIIYPR